MEGVYVFENVWTWDQKRIPLQKVARQHIELAELFLKLITHLGTDEDGNIDDETLAFSEWRYITYLRFLDISKFTPTDHPPPLDVALIWYCHVMTPSRFYGHLWTSKTRYNPTFGLAHRHFPMTRILSMEWSPKETQRLWDKWNHNKKGTGHQLTYQLWPSPPWEEPAPNRRQSTSSGLFSRLLKRSSVHGGEPNQLNANAGAGEAPGDAKAFRSERRVVMQTWNRCALGSGADLPKAWDIAAYTAFRKWERHERCKSQSLHEQYSQQCELRPWEALQDLREDLNRFIRYWKALIHARVTIPRFTDGLTKAVDDYKNFLFIFREGIARFKKGHYVSKFDPKPTGGQPGSQPPGPSRARFDWLIPPTLEIDLLWRTHRLFPGNYWEFSLIRALWVVEPEFTAGASSAQVLLAETRQEWKKKLEAECPRTNAIDEWFESYIPDAARPAPGGIDREPLRVLLNGRNEMIWGIRRHRTDVYNPGGGGGGVGGDSSGTGGGCGGDGGGGGGGGGDGGG